MNSWNFTSVSNWFSIKLPENWSEYEDEEGTYAFFNKDEWSGNLRITPFRWENNDSKAHEYIKEELEDNSEAIATKIGDWDAAFYSKKSSDDSLIYFWVTGFKNNIFLCSFSVNKNIIGTIKCDKELCTVEEILSNIRLNLIQ